jgi:hypothetical protein
LGATAAGLAATTGFDATTGAALAGAAGFATRTGLAAGLGAGLATGFATTAAFAGAAFAGATLPLAGTGFAAGFGAGLGAGLAAGLAAALGAGFGTGFAFTTGVADFVVFVLSVNLAPPFPAAVFFTNGLVGAALAGALFLPFAGGADLTGAAVLGTGFLLALPATAVFFFCTTLRLPSVRRRFQDTSPTPGNTPSAEIPREIR